MPTGTKYWVYRYRFGGTDRMMVLGSTDQLTLDEAKEQLEKHRAVLKAGDNPVAARKLAKLRKLTDEQDTFRNVAQDWIAFSKDTWAPENLRRVQGILQRHVLPKMGSLPMKKIDRTAVVALVRGLEDAGKAPTARQVRKIMSQVFDWAIDDQRADTNPTRIQMKPKAEVQHHSPQAIAVLNALAQESNRGPTSFLFPQSDPKKHRRENVIKDAIRRLS